MPAPSDKITYFGQTDYRGKKIKFGIKDSDRAKHMYVIGKTGMGKSTMLENLAVQDIQNGEGVCFIDPHGGSAELLLSYVPEERVNDVVYFAPFDYDYPIALNVMEDIGKDKRPLVASGLIGAMKKVWVDAWSPRMEYLLSNALLALLEYPNSTLLGVNRIFADKDFRATIVANVTDPSVRAFWLDEFAKYSDKFATEATAAIQNKIGQFASNPLIRNIVGQPVSSFDIRKMMDERKIFIINLSKGRIGEGNANLLGSMLITKIYLAAMSRADTTPDELKRLPNFYLYVDEFQSFANESFADILSEARKYHLSLTIAHQYIEQMSEEVRAAVFGNVGTMISFRVGAYDAEVLEKEFAPTFTIEDIVNLGARQIYLKLMIDGQGSSPFSATTLPPIPVLERSYANEVIASSRAQFARPRSVVEDEIKKWHEPVPPPPRDPNAPPETKKYPPGSRPPRPEGNFPPRSSGSPYTPRTQFGPPSPSADIEREFSRTDTPTPAGDVTLPALSPVPPLMIAVPRKPVIVTVPPLHAPAPAEETSPQPAPVSRPFAEAFRGATGVKAPPSHPVTSRPPDFDRRSGTDRRGSEKYSGERAQSQGMMTRPSGTAPISRLPLSVLKSGDKRDKGPTEGNLSALKDAIRQAQNTPPSSSASPPSVTQKTLSEASPRVDHPAPSFLDADTPKGNAPREVPEDVLRNIIEGT